MGNPSQSYGASLAIWDLTLCYLHPTQVNAPRCNPSQPGQYSRFTYPGMIEGWVDLIAARLGIEPTTARSQVRRPNRYATESLLCVVCLPRMLNSSTFSLYDPAVCNVCLICRSKNWHLVVVSTGILVVVYVFVCRSWNATKVHQTWSDHCSSAGAVTFTASVLGGSSAASD